MILLLTCVGVILFTALLLFDISRVVQNNYDHGDGAVILGALYVILIQNSFRVGKERDNFYFAI
tara:strand:- start:2265 stop:2456 length:192 start_codon:yes stop_codon:yes gene_type:complete